MASRGLGSLTLDLIAKIGGFVGPLSQAEREMDKRSRAIERRAYQLGETIGKSLKGSLRGITGDIAGLAAGYLSVTAVFDQFKGAIDNADKLDELSARLSVSTEKLSTLGYAAQLSGSSLDDLAGALPKLAKNIAEAAESGSNSAELFKALGINVRDASGNLRSADALLPEIADKFKTLDNQTTETALAMELFGKSGGDLLEFLNRGSGGIATLEQRARDLGIEIGGDTAGAAAQFKDRLDDLKGASVGLFTQLSADLLPELTRLTQWATEFTRDGSNAKQIADSLATTFETISSVTATLADRLDGVGKVIEGLTVNFYGLKESIAGAFTLDVERVRAAVALFSEARALIFGGAAQATFGRNETKQGAFVKAGTVDFSNVTGGSSAVPAGGTGLQGSLDRFFAGGDGKGRKSKKASGGKSDAEREAESLKREIDSLNESMAQQIALYGQTSEVAKIRYEIEHGGLQKASQAEKEALLLKAQVLDQMKAETEYEKQLADIQRDRDGIDQMISDMEFELDLLGRTNAEREVEIALRHAGANATDEQRESIRALVEQMEAQRKPTEDLINLMDDFRDGASNAIYDFVTGAKSMKDALTDFADDFAKRITKLIADRWVEKLFGAMGTDGSGTTGGNWLGTALGAIFGGGKASGGPVDAGTLYRVNENRPELLSVGGRDFLMMGAQSGRIHPNPSLGGAMALTNNFYLGAPTDPRTQQQIASRNAFELQRAQARNR